MLGENLGPGFDWPRSTTSLREVALISFIASSSHHPSIHPILFFPLNLPLYCASLDCQVLPWLFQHREGLWKAAKHSQCIQPHTHTHRPVVTSQIPSEGSARLASSLLLPLHLRCSLLLRPPCGETQVEPDSCSSATLQSTHASWVPSCPRGEPVGMEV